MNFDVKKNKMFLVTLGIVLVLVVVALLFWRKTVSNFNNASADFGGANDSYEALCRTYKGAPGAELEKAYQADLEALKKQSANFLAAVKTEPLKIYDPSSFKSELRKFDNEIKGEREKRNINIYQGEGFSEFLGDTMAKEAEMKKLSAQFQTVKDVLSVLLANDVLEVVSIERNPGENRDTGFDDEEEDVYAQDNASSDTKATVSKEKFTATPVYFQFAIRPEKTYQVLSQLRDKPYFYIIRNIRTDLQPDPVGTIEDPSDILERLTVDMTIELVQINKPAQAAE